jgi:hypothetical protein
VTSGASTRWMRSQSPPTRLAAASSDSRAITKRGSALARLGELHVAIAFGGCERQQAVTLGSDLAAFGF